MRDTREIGKVQETLNEARKYFKSKIELSGLKVREGYRSAENENGTNFKVVASHISIFNWENYEKALEFLLQDFKFSLDKAFEHIDKRNNAICIREEVFHGNNEYMIYCRFVMDKIDLEKEYCKNCLSRLDILKNNEDKVH